MSSVSSRHFESEFASVLDKPNDKLRVEKVRAYIPIAATVCLVMALACLSGSLALLFLQNYNIEIPSWVVDMIEYVK